MYKSSMTHALLDPLRQLADSELMARTASLAERGRAVNALLVAHLVELEARGLPLAGGFSSMHAYCVEVLRMSDAEAYLRIEASRLARRLPVVLDMLLDGSTSLSCLKVLSPVLKGADAETLLEASRGKRKSEVERLVAGVSPRPDVPTTIRKLPSTPTLLAPTPVAPTATPTADERPSPPPPPPPPPAAPPRAAVAPLSPTRYRYQLTIDDEALALLERARELASHASGDDLDLLKRMLRAFIEDQGRRRFATTAKPRDPKGRGNGSRHIPAAVRRAVYQRDNGQCGYVGPDGRRCGSRRHLQFHHDDPYRTGGEATVDNVTLRCGPHNRLEEQLRFEGTASGGVRARPGTSRRPATGARAAHQPST
jgi:hypothetical protein